MGLINAGDFSPVDSVRFFLRDNYYKGEVFHTDATIFTVRDAALAIGVPGAGNFKKHTASRQQRRVFCFSAYVRREPR